MKNRRTLPWIYIFVAAIAWPLWAAQITVSAMGNALADPKSSARPGLGGTANAGASKTIFMKPQNPATWHADNGNGTFTNPLFFDEFSDPDLIRVGEDYYLTGTTMHTMPGLPVLHSRDLVNWKLLSYAAPDLDMGPDFRLEEGQNIYGKGIWAPSFRFHNGTFYIFAPVGRRNTQIYSATSPSGPWTQREMKGAFHDLSVLFDDDGKTYVVWGYRNLSFAQLNENLDDIVPGTRHQLFPNNSLMGEGAHFYKINGQYFITGAWWDGRMRMPCGRADKPEGPYELNSEISADEEFGLPEGHRLLNESASDFQLKSADPKRVGRMAPHQGGLVQTSRGEWWGFSMMDFNSVGRLTCLSPVTWDGGWPLFGLPGNLKRTPRTWIKPDTGHISPPSAPFQRSDDFKSPQLTALWQWNHRPVAEKWSLSERPGFLRLHSLPAPDFWNARNTLTQRAIGPNSSPSVRLEVSGLKSGDIAGLGLLNYPYAWIGVSRDENGLELRQFDQRTGQTARQKIEGKIVWLRADCDFLSEVATFHFSTDGKNFRPFGAAFTMIFQGRTFQGVRYSLFSFNTSGAPEGYADFAQFRVAETPKRSIPVGKTVVFHETSGDTALKIEGETRFRVVELPLGRVALQTGDGRFVSIQGNTNRATLERAKNVGDAQRFQWTEMPRGDVLLLSLASNRHLRMGADGGVFADAPGAQPDRKNGASFEWRAQKQ